MEALTVFKQQLDLFNTQVENLEEAMNNNMFYDSSDLAICERLLQDHQEYLFNMQTKYDLVLDIIKKKSN